MTGWQQFWDNPINLTCTLISVVAVGVGLVWVALHGKLFLLSLKNLRRNKLRTILTGTAIIIMVLMATLIWTLVAFLDRLTADKSKNFKLLVTEKWQAFGLMPMTHAKYLDPDSPEFLDELKDLNVFSGRDFMVWSFYGGVLHGQKQTQENLVFFFCLNPRSAMSMMDDLEDIDPKLIAAMENPSNPQACLLGVERLKFLKLQVGQRIKLEGLNYKGIDLELDIVGTLPEGRYERSGIIRHDYFNAAFEKYKSEKKINHPMAEKRVSLIWLRVPDRAIFDKAGKIIEESPRLRDPPVKVETESAGIGNFLEGFQSMVIVMKLAVVALLAGMALVIAN